MQSLRSKIHLALATLILIACACCARADIEVAVGAVDKTAAQFQATVKALPDPVTSLVALSPMPTGLEAYAGENVEVSGSVVGTAPIATGNLIILDCSGLSVTFQAPGTPDYYWLTTGAKVRCVVKVPPSGQSTASNDFAVLLASAPEGAVSAAEQAEAAAAASAAAAAAAREQAKEAAHQAELAARALALQAAKSRFAGGRFDANLAARAARYDMRHLLHGTPIAPLPPGALKVYDIYRTAVAHLNPRLSAAELDEITTSVLYYSVKENIDPRLVIAMIIAESGFDPMSTSRTGAMGLGQLMPGTAAGLGVTNAYDPIQNIGAAVHILSTRIREYGGADASGDIPTNTLILCMAAYNAGDGAVKRYGGVPPYRETQVYVRRVAALYRQLCSDD